MGKMSLVNWLDMTDEIATQFRDLQKENASLRGANEALKQGGIRPEIVESLREEVNNLQKENTDLLGKIEYHTGNKIWMQHQIEELESEKAQLEEDIEALKQGQNRELALERAKNERLWKENKNLWDTNSALELESWNLKNQLDPDALKYVKISEHNDIVTDLLKQQMATALEVVNLKQQVEDLQAEVASACNDLMESHRREIATANEKVKIEDELSTLKEHLCLGCYRNSRVPKYGSNS